MQRLVQGPEQRLPDWRQVADNMLARIYPNTTWSRVS